LASIQRLADPGHARRSAEATNAAVNSTTDVRAVARITIRIPSSPVPVIASIAAIMAPRSTVAQPTIGHPAGIGSGYSRWR
jgi:hypothetical protein